MIVNWNKISIDINTKFNLNTRIVIPDALTHEILTWFHEVENIAFREELRYSDTEVRELWHKDNKLFIFLVDETGPLAVHIGYDLESNSETYYIDTLATKVEGKGIGSIMMKYIKEYAQEKGYTNLQLNTEEINERGGTLQRFYEKHGFQIVYTYPDGNIIMKFKI